MSKLLLEKAMLLRRQTRDVRAIELCDLILKHIADQVGEKQTCPGCAIVHFGEAETCRHCAPDNSKKAAPFDKKTYMREYMRKLRAKQKANG